MAIKPSDLIIAARAALANRYGAVLVVPGPPLRGSRSVVMRATAHTQGGQQLPLVLEAGTGSGEGSVREEAALRLLAADELDVVVPLLAVGDQPPVLVLADLGEHPTLADYLLGTDADAAADALSAWAVGLGTLQARTTAWREEFAAALDAASPLGPPLVDASPDAVAETVTVLTRALPRLGLLAA